MLIVYQHRARILSMLQRLLLLLQQRGATFSIVCRLTRTTALRLNESGEKWTAIVKHLHIGLGTMRTQNDPRVIIPTDLWLIVDHVV